MSVRKVVVAVLLLGSALTQEVAAQDKAVGFKVRAGSIHGISNLNDAGTAELNQRGYNFGAGVNFEFSKYVAVRGDVDLSRNELQINETDTGRDLSRMFYDASLQFTYPIKDFKAYVFIGAGAVNLHPVGTNDADKSQFAGTGGLGVTYTIPDTGLGIGIEGKSWLYQFEGV